MGCCNSCFGRNSERTNTTVPISINGSGAASDDSPQLCTNVISVSTELDPLQSFVEWNLNHNPTVGETTVATVNFICRNGTPYVLTEHDDFKHSIIHQDDPSVTVTSIREPSSSLAGLSSVRVSFTPRINGSYKLKFCNNGKMIGGQTFVKLYIAGPPVLSNTVVHNQTNLLIMKLNIYCRITISAKDAYGNVAHVSSDQMSLETKKGSSSGTTCVPECIVGENNSDPKRLDILVKLNEPGYYVGSLKYAESIIGMQNCEIICLTGEEYARMEANTEQALAKFLRIGYDAKLISLKNKKAKVVECFISQTLFQIREKNLKFFSSRLFTYRVCNSTKFQFHEDPGKFTIDASTKTPVTLISESREVIAAVFYSFLQQNSGDARNFQEKKRHFQTELRRLNPQIESDDQVDINVNRSNLLESAMDATRRFNSDMWKKKFFVSFEGESGIDVGGVSREFFNCICTTLFSARNPKGLFSVLSDNPQGLVHPTSRRDREPFLTNEHYEFAGQIVGKCLFDTAIGRCPLFVNACFTRSFLAQIIGSRVTWEHFETDDPSIWCRVEHVRDDNVEDLELSLKFADEIIENGHSTSDPLVVPFFRGGAKQRVTDDNKMEYLAHLAQHRLVKSVSEEIKHFMKGLKELIPGNLLEIFDESELELLICGIHELSFDDLKQHTAIRGDSMEFLQSVDWFWTVVREFSSAEMARLVQFVTGSPKIPPEGFSELKPPFLLAPSGEGNNRLPYAHTCFNHLCLPNYDTYEQFRRSLMTAINEGSEGILLS